MKKLSILFSFLFAFILSNGQVNKDYIKTLFPDESTIGTFYDKNSWLDVKDFYLNGTAATTIINTDHIKLSGGSQNSYSNYVSYSLKNELRYWKQELYFKLFDWDATSAISIGTKSFNIPFPIELVARLTTKNTGTNKLYLFRPDGSIYYDSTSALTMTQGDDLYLSLECRDSIFIATFRNITTSSSTFTCQYNLSVTSDGNLPNAGYNAIYPHGGQFELQHLILSSMEVKNPNLLVIGDSKTIGQYAGNFYKRYVRLLNANYPLTEIFAGGADRVIEMLKLTNEIALVNPKKIILNIGSNDLRFGGTLADLKEDYTLLTNFLLNSGVDVYHIVMPEDSTGGGVGMTAFKNWVSTTYGTKYINNVWDSMQTSNVLKAIYNNGDGIHPNTAGNLVAYNAIVASGKITLRQPFKNAQILNTDGNISLLNGKLSLNTDILSKFPQAYNGQENYVARWLSPNQLGKGALIDNGTVAAIGTGFALAETFEVGGTMRTYKHTSLATDIGETVSVGQTTTGYKLDVNGDIRSIGSLRSTGSSAALYLNRRDNDAAEWALASFSGELTFINPTSGVNKFVINGNGSYHFYDTGRVDKVFSYNSNIHNTFTQYSHVDKSYVDSINLKWSVVTASPTSNYTIVSNNFIKLADLTGQADRTVTLPSSPVSGQSLVIQNLNTNTSTFNWSTTGGTIKDAGLNTITTLTNLTVYHLVFDGTNWQMIN